MHIPTFIEEKRDGCELAADEIAEFIRGYTSGEVPDYQAAAWAMAVYFKGMSAAETGALTRAMMNSGSVLKHPAGSPPKVDKHSTGGIGDKVSLILAPLLACDEFGVAMIGQTANLCPADKKLYALRDVTATVPSIPLIVASIMSKKLAESLDRLVLDVKFGSGAFMQTRADAETLAAALCATGRECGVKTEAILTPMSEPLGHTAGNALEVWESVETLQGRGPSDLVKLTLDLAERVANVPRAQLAKWLQDGTAWSKWVELVEAQGGRATDTEQILSIHAAPICHVVHAKQDGTLTRMDAGLIGRACIALGAGRSKATDTIDFAVGVSAIAKTGTKVNKGDPLLTVHARDEHTLSQALALIEQAVGLA